MVPVSNVSEISAPASPPDDTRIPERFSTRAEENAVPMSKRDPADFSSAGLAGFPHAFDPNDRGASERFRKSPFVESISPDLSGGDSSVSPFNLDPAAHPNSAANRDSNCRTDTSGFFHVGGSAIGRAMEDELRRENVWRLEGERWGRDERREDERGGKDERREDKRLGKDNGKKTSDGARTRGERTIDGETSGGRTSSRGTRGGRTSGRRMIGGRISSGGNTGVVRVAVVQIEER